MRTEAIPRSPSGDVGVRTGERESARVRVRARVRLGPTRPAGLGALRSTAAECVCRLSALGLLHPATSPRRALLLPPPMLSAASGLTTATTQANTIQGPPARCLCGWRPRIDCRQACGGRVKTEARVLGAAVGTATYPPTMRAVVEDEDATKGTVALDFAPYSAPSRNDEPFCGQCG